MTGATRRRSVIPMFLGALLLVALLLLGATALLQWRTRRQITGATALGAKGSLDGDAGATRAVGRETARQESTAIRHMGEGGL